jgi:hypothetical protein
MKKSEHKATQKKLEKAVKLVRAGVKHEKESTKTMKSGKGKKC